MVEYILMLYTAPFRRLSRGLLYTARQNIQFSKIKDRVQQSERLEHARALRIAEHWWAWVESNYRPHPYQGCALAN